MSLHLTAFLCDQSIKMMTILPGQTASVGASLWNEFSIPDDAALADIHFEIQYDRWPVVQSGPNSTGLLYGNEVVTIIELDNFKNSNIEFIAGNTQFRICCSNDTVRTKSVVELEMESESVASRGSARPLLIDIAREMSIPLQYCSELNEKHAEGLAPRLFVESLCTIGASDHAMTFLTRLLPHSLAIRWWALSEKRIAQVDGELWTLIKAWSDGPNEERRAAIADYLVAAPKQGISRYVAESICFTGGSLAAAGVAHVPPPANLPAVALSTAFKLSLSLSADETCAEMVTAGMMIFEQSLLEAN